MYLYIVTTFVDLKLCPHNLYMCKHGLLARVIRRTELPIQLKRSKGVVEAHNHESCAGARRKDCRGASYVGGTGRGCSGVQQVRL